MSTDPQIRPYGELDHESPGGASPHLADYWQVISRRLWLVLLIFGVTTASAIWAVSRQRVYYRAHASLQVNDPTQPARGLVASPRLSGIDIYVDPIESEIQVFQSSQIALAVVDSLGLRLQPAGGDVARSDLARDVWVAQGAPSARYEVVYDPEGRSAAFRTREGAVLGSAPVGSVLDAGEVRFELRSPPGEARVYPMEIVPATTVAARVSGSLTATPRENTNLIDAYYVSADPVLTPKVVNTAGHVLRERGARRMAQRARGDIEFIEQRLDSARQQLARSAADIRSFKQSSAYTSLSSQEQQLLDRIQQTRERLEALDAQRAALADLGRELEEHDARGADLVAPTARLPEGSHAEIRSLVDELQEKRSEIRSLLTEQQLARQHPRVRFLQDEIDALGRRLQEAVTANRTVLEDRIEELAAQAEDLRAERRQFPDLETQLQALEEQRTIDQQTFSFLQSQLYQAQITHAAIGPYVEIVDEAGVATPIQPRGRINVFLGALLGLILGVGAAFFLEYLDRTVRTSSDVETLLGIPVLGIIPRLRRVREEGVEEQEIYPGKGLPLVVAQDPLDPAAEAYRNLRMNLMFMSTEDRPIRSILFSSPGPDEGKSTTAVNFAVMLAQQGQRVLLVDADLRRPALHRSLDLLREPGLTNLLVGDATSREAIRPNVLPNLDVLPSGPFPPNPSELLNSKAMQRLLEEFEGKYSQIIIDSPPVLAVTDSAVLGTHTDGLVLVLRSGETEQRAAERSVEQLRRLGVRVFGAVLNEVSTTTAEETYYLQYYYSYHPSTESGWDRIRKGLSRARFW